MTTLENFITENKVRLSCEWVSERPDHLMDSRMNHWKCKLSANGRIFTFYFSQGYGFHGAEPTLPDVLESFASDFRPEQSFEEFCDDYGYDEDSRKAERIYKAVVKQNAAIERLFGSEKIELLQEIIFNQD